MMIIIIVIISISVTYHYFLVLDKFSKMRQIFSKILQIMVSLKNDHLVKENKRTEYCYCFVFFKERSNFDNLVFSHSNSKQ